MWELEHKEGWVLKKWCFRTGLDKTLESPLDSRQIKSVNSKGNFPTLNIRWEDWCWSWSSNTLATWCEEPTNWNRPWCWERLKAEEEGDRGWDSWMASLMHHMNLGKPQETVGDWEACPAAVHEVTKSWTELGKWTIAKLQFRDISGWIAKGISQTYMRIHSPPNSPPIQAAT